MAAQVKTPAMVPLECNPREKKRLSLDSPALCATLDAQVRLYLGEKPPALSRNQRAEIAHMRDQARRGIVALSGLFQISPNSIRQT